MAGWSRLTALVFRRDVDCGVTQQGVEDTPFQMDRVGGAKTVLCRDFDPVALHLNVDSIAEVLFVWIGGHCNFSVLNRLFQTNAASCSVLKRRDMQPLFESHTTQ